MAVTINNGGVIQTAGIFPATTAEGWCLEYVAEMKEVTTGV